MTPMPERTRALLALNGLGLLVFAVFVGWQWMFALLGHIVLWPIIPPIDVQLPTDHRAWRMAHMEGITQGLMLIAFGGVGQFFLLTRRWHNVFFWSAIITAWVFSVPTYFHALLGTRGLAFGGGPFKGGIGNDILYLVGWPPVIAVHLMLAVAIVGIWRYLKSIPRQD
ncbi:MAG: hypothetical protein QM698_05450 [Micropepsaceae bacterium]